MPQKQCPSNKKLECIDCRLYQEYVDHNISTGSSEILHKCAILLHNDLLVQLADKQNQTGAAIESFRNEVVKQQELPSPFEVPRLYGKVNIG